LRLYKILANQVKRIEHSNMFQYLFW